MMMCSLQKENVQKKEEDEKSDESCIISPRRCLHNVDEGYVRIVYC